MLPPPEFIRRFKIASPLSNPTSRILLENAKLLELGFIGKILTVEIFPPAPTLLPPSMEGRGGSLVCEFHKK